ncbi:probable plastidic glucose transporter 2 isoform X1 [Tanacetum coccineum]
MSRANEGSLDRDPCSKYPGLLRCHICFWLSTIPSMVLALAMIFCAESPPWLYKKQRNVEAEVEFQNLLGPANVRSAMTKLLKSDKEDENDTVTISELISGRHSRVNGALRCLALLSMDMDDKLVPRIIPVLFLCLHAIVSSPHVNSNF